MDGIMNLLVAKTTLESKPPKHLVELTAYEFLAMLAAAMILVIAF